jgi:hypothetical protein
VTDAGLSAVDFLSTSEVVSLATTTIDGREIVTPIGVVVVDGAGYIRSQNGARAKWYRRVQRSGQGAFLDGSARYPVTIENVTDAATIRRVDKATYAKYGGPVRNLLLMTMLRMTRKYVMRAALLGPEDRGGGPA